MRSYSDRQTGYLAGLNGIRDDMPDSLWATQEKVRLEREEQMLKEAVWQVKVQNFTRYSPPIPPPSSPRAGLRKYIVNGGRLGILTAICVVLMSPDRTTIPLIILATVFFVLGVIAGALVCVVLSIVASLLKIGLLLIAAVVVSGLVMRGYTPTIGKIETEKSSDIQTGLKPHITDCNHQRRLRWYR